MRCQAAISILGESEFIQKIKAITIEHNLNFEVIIRQSKKMKTIFFSRMLTLENSATHPLLHLLEDEGEMEEMGAIFIPDFQNYILYYGHPSKYGLSYNSSTLKLSYT